MARKTSFYFAFLVLPADQRRAITAVWDFCRAVDDAVDEVERDPSDPKNIDNTRERSRVRAADALAGWRAELARCYSGGTPATTQGAALQPFITRFDLPRSAFEDVIDGVAMDLDTSRYRTFAELFEYCRRVASAVGLICIRIFGCQGDRAREYAFTLGIALQLTNILRDVKRDWAMGRLYLPLEDLARFECSVADLEAGRVSDPLRRLMAFECARAREYFQRAVEARPPEDRARLVAAEIMRAVYFETLRRIELSGYDVFSTSARVPRPQQAIIALRQWLWQA
jgi:phytoene synthase